MGLRPAPRPADQARVPVPAAPAADSFLACLRQSGLVPPARLADFLDGRPDGMDGRNLASGLVRENLLTRWQADKILAGRCRGFRLGSYTLLSLLGRGGMSAVYLAEHNVMRRKCAVKVLPAKLLGGGSHLERFLREARAVAALDHPNIVRAYDVASEGEGASATYYLVMELVVGRSLYDLVKREGPVAPDRVGYIGRETARGLAHAHAAGIVHRDVKPGNVLLADSGAVKVTDLGLARGSDEEHSLTIAHDEKVLGTADYLAPEQALDSHTVDHRADIYGLGCTLYFSLCGHGPFTDGTLAQRLMAHQSTPAPPIESIADGVPGDLAAAIGRMLEKRPDDRFQTMGEVAAALSPAAVGNGGGPPAPAPAREEPTERELSDFLARLGGDAGDARSGGPGSAVRAAAGAKSGGRTGRKSGRRSGRAAAEPAEFAVELDEHSPLPLPASAAAGETGEAELGPLDFAAAKEDRTGTRRSSRRKSSRNSPEPAPNGEEPTPPPVRPKWPLIAAALAGLATAAGLAFWFTRDDTAAPPDRPPTAAAAERDGPSTIGEGGDFPTLAAALRDLRENYRPSGRDDVRVVSLPPGRLREGLIVDNSDFSFPKGVKFVGDAAGTTLAPPGNGPAVSLRGLSGFALENIAVDAAGRDVAVELGGFLSRVTLTDVAVRNLSGTGLLLDGVAGGGLRTEIVGLTVDAAPDAAEAVGVRLSGSGAAGVTFTGGALNGPLGVGVDLDAAAKAVTVKDLRIGPAAVGVRFGGVTLKDLALDGLVFDGVERGLLFAAAPSRGSGGLIVADCEFIDAAEPVALDTEPGPIRAVLDAPASAGNAAANPGDDPLGLFGPR